MLTKTLHALVAHPWVYEQVRLLVGARRIDRRLAHHIETLPLGSLVLDLGGGTGVLRRLLPMTCTYVCLDTDVLKLRGFSKGSSNGCAVLSDATQAPVRSESADLVFCTLVSHHLPDETLARLIRESYRLLKKNGRFIFLDAVWAPARWAGWLLWKFDRGRYPRTAEALHRVMSAHYKIVEWERFAIYHEYALCVAAKSVTE